MSDTLVFPRLAQILQCVVDTFENAGRTPLCAAEVRAGATVTADYVASSGCLDGGTDGFAFVRLGNVFHTTNFPQPAVATNCTDPAYIAFTVDVGVFRTGPIEQDGNPAPSDEWLAASAQQAEEMLLIRDALLCCYPGDLVLGQWIPAGPLGYAIGGYWTATVSTLDDQQ